MGGYHPRIMRDKPLGIRRITGERLRRAVTAGARKVIAQADQLDQINVFPVADFDTGKNLAVTMGAILHVPPGLPWRPVGAMARDLATATLRGARGNSGVIFAQFFHGLAEGLGGASVADVPLFARALARAAARSHQALAEPKEGTILTAITAFANRVEELAGDTEDFVPLMQNGLVAAELALAKTSSLLPILRDAGIVDAGALAFVRFVEGIVHYIATGKMEEVSLVGANPPLDRPTVKYDPEAITFRYCTECVVEGDGIELEAIREVLGSLGDSVVVAGSPEFFHLHVHTNAPARVRELAAAFGTVAREKVDDMWVQHAESAAESVKAGLALVVDTSCDLPEFLMTRHRIAIVPVRVRVGTEEFRDRTELTVRGFYERVQSGAETSTSQPPPADFLDAFVHLGRRFPSILALVLAKGLSGTWNSASQAAREAAGTGCGIEVVDSGTLSGGLGLVAWAVARGIEAGLRLREAAQLAREAAKRVVFWAALPDLRPLARSGRAPWAVGWLSERTKLGLVAAVGQGRIRPVGAGVGRGGLVARLAALGAKAARAMEVPTGIIPHAMAIGAAEALAGRLGAAVPSSRVDLHLVDASPALVAHAGLGAFGLALLDMGWVARRIVALGGNG